MAQISSGDYTLVQHAPHVTLPGGPTGLAQIEREQDQREEFCSEECDGDEHCFHECLQRVYGQLVADRGSGLAQIAQGEEADECFFDCLDDGELSEDACYEMCYRHGGDAQYDFAQIDSQSKEAGGWDGSGADVYPKKP